MDPIGIRIETGKYNKPITIIEGVSSRFNIKEIKKELIKSIGCGGSINGDIIQLQGDHFDRVYSFFIGKGLKHENIKLLFVIR